MGGFSFCLKKEHRRKIFVSSFSPSDALPGWRCGRMRQEPRQAVRVIRDRVRINAFTFTRYSFERMVDQGIDEEDVKRAIASSRLVETATKRAGGRTTSFRDSPWTRRTWFSSAGAAAEGGSRRPVPALVTSEGVVQVTI
jgi:hypothetical protein